MKLVTTLSLTLFITVAFGQFEDKKVQDQPGKIYSIETAQLDKIIPDDAHTSQIAQTPFDFHQKSISLQSLMNAKKNPTTLQYSDWGTPAWISGELNTDSRKRFYTVQDAYTAYIEQNLDILPIDHIEQDIRLVETKVTNEKNLLHAKIQQRIDGIDVFGGEAYVHIKKKEGQPYAMTGRFYPNRASRPSNLITEASAIQIIKNHFSDSWRKEPLKLPGYDVTQLNVRLNWYPIERTKELVLAYVADVYPDFLHKQFIVINAETGEIIDAYLNMCMFAGPFNTAELGSAELNQPDQIKSCGHAHSISHTSASAGSEIGSGLDLFGINRNFHVYEEGGTYFMIDISRPMYDAPSSSLPSDPIGAIRTLDGLNNPFLGSINYAHVTTTTNTWSDRASVSAHYNAGQAYEYFVNVHGRNSINGSGGTITSLIHVTDENDQPMDNAFWNGEAMFYGDGNQGFFSLARGLDVAGHEISHGVVQNTANLVYQNEPGALNESFADVFGAMIDREDWQIGEDVVRTSAFPTGALRDMQDPTQGLSNLNQNGYQPAHYSDRYTGTQDRGGVHINSGIPNRAFYLFATSIGKAKAEEIYYHALSNYLTRSSQFSDCRAAVMQSAKDLYGNAECEAAATAFTQVGISGATCSGGGQVPGDNLELPVNPGADRIVVVSDVTGNPLIYSGTGTLLADPLSNTQPKSKPSVSDDGSRIMFINQNDNIHFISIDWSVPEVTNDQALTSDGAWRNVAISKDGTLAAATTLSPQNSITVFDLSTGNGQTYPLTNPTTGGVATGDVLYSDAMEFDYSGRNVLYDAVNEISGNTENIQYWDIGVLRAWDKDADNFGDGQITKLFAGLPENVSVGNPTLSKTRPNVLAYDLVESTFFGDEYYLYASNFETNETQEVFSNLIVSYPSYSRTDDRLIFNARDSYDNNVVGQINVSDDKITPTSNATIFLDDVFWGNWFGTGQRNINVSTTNPILDENIVIKPNPAQAYVNISIGAEAGMAQQINIRDISGSRIGTVEALNQTEVNLAISSLSDGMYIIEIITSKGKLNKQLIKISTQ